MAPVRDPQWHDRLRAAVTPLASGVRSLKVAGYRPSGTTGWRPNRTAAVLVPLLDLDEPEVVLTRRADHLPTHAGQISFPGGAAEEDDRTAVDTALREAWEEIGLPAERVTPIGFLDRMDTISDYRVLPVVALVRRPAVWRPDQSEVAEVFSVPVSVALDRNRYESRIVTRDQERFTIHSLQWGEYTIWGATAAMLLNLAHRLESANVR
ncbi:CoA pyrophosphatase [Elongatibacter sediminis]|uniref:CoA pyrophosphatase n=1 Tax=Elongatibacter sediminis TaxID=3119006 RepID=A0AAW9RFH8_9GAMM